MSEDDSRFLVQDRTEIERILESLKLLRLPVSVQFEGSDGSHMSMVVEVDAGERVFFLDLLGLPEGRRMMEKALAFSLHGILDGVTVALLRCKSQGVATVQGVGEAYRIPYPEAVFHRQQRDNFRARVLRSMEIPFTLRGRHRRGALDGRLDDISNLGCRLVFREPPFPPLKSHEVFADLQIQTPKPFGTLIMAAETRHVEVNRESNVVSSGFRFVDLRPNVRTQVQRFVVHLQREAMRAQRR